MNNGGKIVAEGLAEQQQRRQAQGFRGSRRGA